MHKPPKTTLFVLLVASLLSCRVFDYIGNLGAAGTSTPLPQDTPASQPPTSTPAPTGLNPTGPHIVFEGSGGIWITNPDGSYPTRITEYELNGSDLRRAVSPAGDRLTLVVKNDQGLDLVLVKIPGGETKIIAHLLNITTNELNANAVSPKAFASYAIADYNSLAWSPGDGSLLAFIGAINGPSADLYLYDTQTEKITQLTNGPSQAIYPNWSPDGGYILHYGVSWTPPFGGAIVGYNRLDGVWAVQVSDGKVITQPKPKGNHEHFVGWQDEAHYITFDSNYEDSEGCNATNLRSVEVSSGEVAALMEQSFDGQIAQSPEDRNLLFSTSAGCPTSPGEGVFILLPGQTTPTRLLYKIVYEINWLQESSVFQAYPEALFSSDGHTRYNSPVYDKSFNPAISKNGYQAWEVIENRQGRVELKVPGADWREIMKGSVAEMVWDPIAGNILLIALQNGELYAASFPDFTPRLMGNLDGRVNQAIWLP